MNRAAIRRILQGTPTTPSAVVELPPADPLADLLTTPVRHLKAPLAVASSVVADTIYLVANDDQAATVRATGGIPYTPEEISLLWALHETTDPAAWGKSLRLIHEAKRRFDGSIISESRQ